MKYITGMHALNCPCSLETTGDWHMCNYDWDNPEWAESADSIFDDYGIEEQKIPNHSGTFMVANTLRALLDMLEQGHVMQAAGARDDYICNEFYTSEFMSNVLRLKYCTHWNEIDEFMKREYYCEWLRFKESNNVA